MRSQSRLDLFTFIIVGFTVAHGLLSALPFVSNQLYYLITYHYSDYLIWYLLFFILPLLTGIAVCFWMRNMRVSKGLRIVFYSVAVVQIVFTIGACTKNYNYWGYFFRRPTVFGEVS